MVDALMKKAKILIEVNERLPKEQQPIQYNDLERIVNCRPLGVAIFMLNDFILHQETLYIQQAIKQRKEEDARKYKTLGKDSLRELYKDIEL